LVTLSLFFATLVVNQDEYISEFGPEVEIPPFLRMLEENAYTVKDTRKDI